MEVGPSLERIKELGASVSLSFNVWKVECLVIGKKMNGVCYSKRWSLVGDIFDGNLNDRATLYESGFFFNIQLFSNNAGNLVVAPLKMPYSKMAEAVPFEFNISGFINGRIGCISFNRPIRSVRTSWEDKFLDLDWGRVLVTIQEWLLDKNAPSGS
ncbi:hypothetical protein Tco_0748460 [Tanacetum coccineum]|uniref:Uncharacterized protein n=1 Tax=Tanacetum coccineum TaxID=301880 RepID=A0ABQ4YVP4_9ASTR